MGRSLACPVTGLVCTPESIDWLVNWVFPYCVGVGRHWDDIETLIREKDGT